MGRVPAGSPTAPAPAAVGDGDGTGPRVCFSPAVQCPGITTSCRVVSCRIVSYGCAVSGDVTSHCRVEPLCCGVTSQVRHRFT